MQHWKSLSTKSWVRLTHFQLMRISATSRRNVEQRKRNDKGFVFSLLDINYTCEFQTVSKIKSEGSHLEYLWTMEDAVKKETVRTWSQLFVDSQVVKNKFSPWLSGSPRCESFTFKSEYWESTPSILVASSSWNILPFPSICHMIWIYARGQDSPMWYIGKHLKRTKFPTKKTVNFISSRKIPYCTCGFLDLPNNSQKTNPSSRDCGPTLDLAEDFVSRHGIHKKVLHVSLDMSLLLEGPISPRPKEAVQVRQQLPVGLQSRSSEIPRVQRWSSLF